MASSTAAPEPFGHLPELRVSTGVPALDTILHGGLVARRPYLVVGPAGTGKTTLALEFLCQGVREKERVLIVTLEEPPNEMKANHRSLRPELDDVYVFDAIPDIMRYERAPFRDIATVRQSVKFRDVADSIRKSPELASVEVTLTALEQTIRTEISRFNYSRIVIDSLTALQYFCMKGFDETAGAQSFLRFLSDLRVTTLLTVESPLEDVDTPERLLARGEIRLFRWELDGTTVRAVGVEKFRGSPHDVCLHPYRIGPQGIDVNLESTISRDTRKEVAVPSPLIRKAPVVGPRPQLVLPSTVGPWTQDLLDLSTVGADLRVVRDLIQRASAAAREDQTAVASELLLQVRGEVASMVQEFSHQPLDISLGKDEERTEAARRLVARAAEARVGLPPPAGVDVTALPSALDALLSTSAVEVPGPREGWPAAAVPTVAPAADSPRTVRPSISVVEGRDVPTAPSRGEGPESSRPSPDLASVVARLPLERVDEPGPAPIPRVASTSDGAVNWESPARIPEPVHGGTASTPQRITPPPSSVFVSVEPPPLPQPKSEVEFVTMPSAPGSPTTAVVRLPVHVAPAVAVVAASGGSAFAAFEVPGPAALDRPPLPTLASAEPPRPILRPVATSDARAPTATPADVSAPAPRAVRRTSRVREPSVGGSADAGAVPRATAKRRRRSSSTDRRKKPLTPPTSTAPALVAPPKPAPPVSNPRPPTPAMHASPPLLESPPALPTPLASTASPTPTLVSVSSSAPVSGVDASLAKPKRRPARRRKAPPVTGVAPGSRPMVDPSSAALPATGVVSPSAPSQDPGPSTASAVGTPAPGPSTDPPVDRRE